MGYDHVISKAFYLVIGMACGLFQTAKSADCN